MEKKMGQEANPGSLEPISSPGGEGEVYTIAPANDQHIIYQK